jgi:hypothetical protein
MSNHQEAQNLAASIYWARRPSRRNQDSWSTGLILARSAWHGSTEGIFSTSAPQDPAIDTTAARLYLDATAGSHDLRRECDGWTRASKKDSVPLVVQSASVFVPVAKLCKIAFD